MSHHFRAEIRFLGVESSPAFVREPEGNGCAERFIRTLKENLLWVRRFETIEQLRQALLAFQDSYNRTWGDRPPRIQDAKRLSTEAASNQGHRRVDFNPVSQ